MTSSTDRPSFEDALLSRQRRAVGVAVLSSILLGTWSYLLVCQITDDFVRPIPAPALLIIGVVALLLTCALITLCVIASRSPRIKEQHRIAAAIKSAHLPAGVDVDVWQSQLQKRADQNPRNRLLLLAPLLSAIAAFQLSRTSNDIYGTMLWTSYLAVMLVVVLTSLTTYARTRSTAQQLLAQLDRDIEPD